MRERRWLAWLRLALGASLVAATGLALVGPMPAAAATISGGGSFTISMHLDWFPCPGTCGSSISGTFAGQISGLDNNGAQYTVEFPDPTLVPPVPGPNFVSTGMSNGDFCSPPTTGLPAIAITNGSATGTFAITDGLLTRGSVISHGGQLTGGFFWSRTTATGTLGLSSVSVSDGSGATVSSSGTLGLAAGGAAFTVPPAAATATCDALAANVTATLTGVEAATV